MMTYVMGFLIGAFIISILFFMYYTYEVVNSKFEKDITKMMVSMVVVNVINIFIQILSQTL